MNKSTNNISLVTDDINDTNSVSNLLKEKDILTNINKLERMDKLEKMEQGLSNTNTKGIVFDYEDSTSDENNYESEDENLITLSANSIINVRSENIVGTFKKLDYKDVEYRIDRAYFDINHKYSSALDILASYLKGHKIIYMESKFFCETHLNMYMMPAILLSSAATVLTSFITTYKWGTIFIASLNAIIACLLAIVNYLKLDAASEAHKISSHQYDKLQSTVEFTSGSVLLFRYNDLQRLEYEYEHLNSLEPPRF